MKQDNITASLSDGWRIWIHRPLCYLSNHSFRLPTTNNEAQHNFVPLCSEAWPVDSPKQEPWNVCSCGCICINCININSYKDLVSLAVLYLFALSVQLSLITIAIVLIYLLNACSAYLNPQIGGLVQDCGNTSALSVELPQSCTQPLIMVSSSNGNIFRITGPLCREFTGHRCIPLTKASDVQLCYFLWSVPE